MALYSSIYLVRGVEVQLFAYVGMHRKLAHGQSHTVFGNRAWEPLLKLDCLVMRPRPLHAVNNGTRPKRAAFDLWAPEAEKDPELMMRRAKLWSSLEHTVDLEPLA